MLTSGHVPAKISKPSLPDTVTQGVDKTRPSAQKACRDSKTENLQGNQIQVPGDTHRELAHQTTNFAQLAHDQGFRYWNNSVFDDRWLLQPEEMYKIYGGRKSDLTVSPDRKSTGMASLGPSDVIETEAFPASDKSSFQSFDQAQKNDPGNAQRPQNSRAKSEAVANRGSMWIKSPYDTRLGLMSKADTEE